MPHFQLRYKYIKNVKTFVEQAFLEYFATLSLSLIYAGEDPEEQLEYFNSMFVECHDRLAPLRRVRLTRPPAKRSLHSNSKEIGRGKRRTNRTLRNHG